MQYLQDTGRADEFGDAEMVAICPERTLSHPFDPEDDLGSWEPSVEPYTLDYASVEALVCEDWDYEDYDLNYEVTKLARRAGLIGFPNA